MAVVARWMALFPVDTAATSAARVTLSAGTPPGTARYPANFRFAHAAFEPVAAPFFHHDNLASWTHEGISPVDHFLEHVAGSSRFDIRITVAVHSILELLAVKPVVNCSTREAIYDRTHGTLELIDVVFVDAPSTAVWRLAVKRVVQLAFRLSYGSGQIGFVHLLRDQGFDLALLNDTLTAVHGIHEWTPDFRFLAVVDRIR